jgi:hypothetical protein
MPADMINNIGLVQAQLHACQGTWQTMFASTAQVLVTCYMARWQARMHAVMICCRLLVWLRPRLIDSSLLPCVVLNFTV